MLQSHTQSHTLVVVACVVHAHKTRLPFFIIVWSLHGEQPFWGKGEVLIDFITTITIIIIIIAWSNPEINSHSPRPKPRMRRPAARRGVPLAVRGGLNLALALGIVLLALAASSAAALAFGFGDYRIDFDFLGGEGDLRPEQ
jgi:hypothetical protein